MFLKCIALSTMLIERGEDYRILIQDKRVTFEITQSPKKEKSHTSQKCIMNAR